MKNTFLKKIQDYYIRISIAILMLGSIFVCLSSLNKDISFPWWFNLIYGWSGLVVSFKLGDFWYKD